ncbi:MAG: DNA-binding response regulator [Saprospiraceae bacterium]|nr:MAG: DNA-binding response regulator [Saprospiraceae bacterium]
MTKPHILFVDDERQFSAMTKEYLEAKGFGVTLKHSADDAIASFKTHPYHLCIFDVKMPIKNGFSLAEDIRALDENIPIVFLTGQTQKEYRIKGLTIGADDYITKPFSVEELWLRVKAILKRVSFQEKRQPVQFEVGKYSFDANSRELYLDLEVIKLSAIEAKLLQLFCENINGLVKRDFALNRIWQDEDHLKGRSLNVYVSKLRSFLNKDDNIEILNVHGEGYRMVVKG